MLRLLMLALCLLCMSCKQATPRGSAALPPRQAEKSPSEMQVQAADSAGSLAAGSTIKPTSGEAVIVWALPQLKVALEALEPSFSKMHSGGLEISYLDRGELRDKLKGEAQPDVYLFGDIETMDELKASGIADELTQRSFAGDTVVIACRAGESWVPESIFDLYQLRFRMLGLGDAVLTTDGYYGYQTLVSDGGYERLKDRILKLTSHEAILDSLLLVENKSAPDREKGQAQIAILLGSTVSTTPGVMGAYIAGEDLHEPVRYQAIAAKISSEKPGVMSFLRFLAEDSAVQQTLQGYGFLGRDAALKLR